MSLLITMAFTDLVDSTAMKAQLAGPDASSRNRVYLEEILSPHRRHVESLLPVGQCRIVKTMGDAYFIVFDNPCVAARWAVAVQQAHSDKPIATPLGPLKVKIGLHTGSPMVDPANPGDYIGQEVDYAARVAALANGGQIVLSQQTAVLIREDACWHAHGERLLKGIGRVEIFELLYDGNAPQPLKEAALSPSNLPPPPVGFTGREGLLAEIGERIHEGGVTILKGEGGNGKTSLALVAAHRAHLAGELGIGVAWLNCELRMGADEAMSQLAQVFLGDRLESESLDHRVAKIGAQFNRGGMVIFDNFETISENPVVHQSMLQWLATVRHPARVLITTRFIPPGMKGHVIVVPELPREEAVQLFKARMEASGQRSEGQEDLIRALCEAVGDQPLAIELLAARAARSPLSRLAARIKDGLGVLESADPTRPDRQQSQKACFNLSFEALGEPAREMFLKLCVLPGGAGPDVIEAVIGTPDWDDPAEELVAASVWRLAGDRYACHPLVRQFGLERLDGRKEEAEALASRALVSLALRFHDQSDPKTAKPEQVLAALKWFESEWGNLLSCFDAAVLNRDDPTIQSIARSVQHFWRSGGSWEKTERMQMASLESARRLGDRQTEILCLLEIGSIRRYAGRWAEAESATREALEHERTWEDQTHQCRTLAYLGNIYRYQRRWPEAEAACFEAIELARSTGDRSGEARALNYLGNIFRFQERWAEAEQNYRAGLAIQSALKDFLGEAQISQNLGNIFMAQERWGDAKEALTRGLAVWESYGRRVDQGRTLGNLGLCYRLEGKLTEAELVLRKAVSLLHDCGDLVFEGGALATLSEVRDALGDRQDARNLAGQAVSRLEKVDDFARLGEVRSLLDRLSSQS